WGGVPGRVIGEVDRVAALCVHDPEITVVGEHDPAIVAHVGVAREQDGLRGFRGHAEQRQNGEEAAGGEHVHH
ncbi:MAG: hypothetical protein IH796_11085, partial [Deltaproteobacteria bacterium]|nr:hypothetical protein [Deltaproteobacteria bacterium]